MRIVAAALLAAFLAFAPGVADARPGMGGSFGSRGTHTWSAPPATSGAPYGASPFQRSYTPNSGYANPGYGNFGNSYGYRRPLFGGGMLGGLLGAGLLGMLLGGGFFGFHGGFGFIGLLIQLFLLYLLAKWLMGRFFGTPAMAGGAGAYARGLFPPLNLNASQGPRPSGYGGPPSQAIAIASADYNQFTQLLLGIQAAWSNHDMNGLQAMATPEMVSYFNEQLSDLASRGLRNQVTDVRLQQGDLSEAWMEGGREYATVSLKFSMVDLTTDHTGRVVDGSATERVTTTEFWTFVRSSGGHWILSAIQQAK